MPEQIEYPPGTPFPGVIGRTAERSVPAWPAPTRARAGAPNVLVIVLDDTGYGQLGCYGSPIRTPTLDGLAQNGLRYSNMHATPLCSPTRACILTGRNHHSNAMGSIADLATGYPGYNGRIPFENGFLSEILLAHGYSTYAVGKWHLTPMESLSAAGPYDRWPLGRGFERFYGFWSAGTSQYHPRLVYDNHQVSPPRRPDEGYHLTEDLVDRAIEFIADSKQVAPDKPFFLYFATGAMHAPHQVRTEWSRGYAGAFDEGWSSYREETFERQLELGVLPPGTRLTPHNDDVPQWASLSADERRASARMMELYAGFLEHTDHEIGRLLAFIESLGQLDDTLVVALSDNGASSEGGRIGSTNEMKFANLAAESLEENLAALEALGGPDYWNHYPFGWAWAGDTPFRRWKRETYRGGISVPFIVHWPARIESGGGSRFQYAHVIDILPTVLDAVRIEAPTQIRGVAQSPIQGVSLLPTFEDAEAPSLRQTQYYEEFGHRSIYHAGWKAVCPWPGPTFPDSSRPYRPITDDDLERIDRDAWELYDLAHDFAEAEDVASHHPDLVREMVARWYVEAGKHDVLPLDGRGGARFVDPRPAIARPRDSYEYYPGTQMIPASTAVNVLNRAHVISADVLIGDPGDEGVLICHGGNCGGYSLFVRDRRLHYVHNYVGSQRFHVASDREIPLGPVRLSYEFRPSGPPDLDHGRGTPGSGTLYIDGSPAGTLDLPVTVPIIFELGGGVEIGRNLGSPVSDLYEPPFSFTGTIRKVTVTVASGAADVHGHAGAASLRHE